MPPLVVMSVQCTAGAPPSLPSVEVFPSSVFVSFDAHPQGGKWASHAVTLHLPMLTRRPIAPCGLLATALVCGCESLADGGKRVFSEDFTCPVDRVQAQPRPDLQPSNLEGRSGPPPGIAADPDRLKMWHDKQAQAKEHDDSRYEIVELRGCGKHLLLQCHRFKGNKFGCTTLFNEVFLPGVTPSL